MVRWFLCYIFYFFELHLLRVTAGGLLTHSPLRPTCDPVTQGPLNDIGLKERWGLILQPNTKLQTLGVRGYGHGDINSKLRSNNKLRAADKAEEGAGVAFALCYRVTQHWLDITATHSLEKDVIW